MKPWNNTNQRQDRNRGTVVIRPLKGYNTLIDMDMTDDSEHIATDGLLPTMRGLQTFGNFYKTFWSSDITKRFSISMQATNARFIMYSSNNKWYQPEIGTDYTDSTLPEAAPVMQLPNLSVTCGAAADPTYTDVTITAKCTVAGVTRDINLVYSLNVNVGDYLVIGGTYYAVNLLTDPQAGKVRIVVAGLTGTRTLNGIQYGRAPSSGKLDTTNVFDIAETFIFTDINTLLYTYQGVTNGLQVPTMVSTTSCAFPLKNQTMHTNTPTRAVTAMTAKACETFESFLFLGNMIEVEDDGTTYSRVVYGNRLRWSAATDYYDFSSPTGWLDLPEDAGEIVKLSSDGQRLLIFTTNGIFYAIPTGSSDIPITIRRMETGGVGITHANQVVKAENVHYFVSSRSFYSITDATLTRINLPFSALIRSDLTDVVNNMLYNRELQTIYMIYVDSIICYNKVTQQATYSVIPTTVYIHSSVMINGTGTSALGLAVQKQTATQWVIFGIEEMYHVPTEQVTSPFPDILPLSNARTTSINHKQPDQVKEWFKFQLHIQENDVATRTATLKFPVSISVDGGNRWTSIGELRIPVGQRFGYLNFRAVGTGIQFKYSNSTVVAPYTITGYTVDVKGAQQLQGTTPLGGTL